MHRSDRDKAFYARLLSQEKYRETSFLGEAARQTSTHTVNSMTLVASGPGTSVHPFRSIRTLYSDDHRDSSVVPSRS